jgi:hypothetical protein
MIHNLTPIKVGKHIRSSDTRRIYLEFVLPPYNLWREMEREWAIMVLYIYQEFRYLEVLLNLCFSHPQTLKRNGSEWGNFW